MGLERSYESRGHSRFGVLPHIRGIVCAFLSPDSPLKRWSQSRWGGISLWTKLVKVEEESAEEGNKKDGAEHRWFTLLVPHLARAATR